MNLIASIPSMPCHSFPVHHVHAQLVTRRLFAKQTTDSAEHTVLLGVVRMVFARDLENGGEGRGVGVDSVPYPISDLYRGFHVSQPSERILTEHDNLNMFPSNPQDQHLHVG